MASQSLEFTGDGVVFSATRQAEAWLTAAGYSYGRMQGHDPRGILKGREWDIQKWRNLGPKERSALDGMMTGDPRNGPVFVTIKGNYDELAGFWGVDEAHTIGGPVQVKELHKDGFEIHKVMK